MSKRRLIGTLLAGFALMLLVPMTATAQDGDSKAETLQIDPVHSNAMFRVNYGDIGYVFGHFKKIDGKIMYHPDDATKSSISISIPTSSVETFNDKRDKHLKGGDFLQAKQFPEMTFESTKVERKNDNTLAVTGDLTIRGTTKEYTIDVKELGSGKGTQGNFRRGFYTEFNIDRTKFDVSWQPESVDKMVRIILAFQGVRQ
jgi:polyisoprenoid-binding protein YceI